MLIATLASCQSREDPGALAGSFAAATPPCPTVPRIAVLEDQTGSRARTLTPQLDVEDLEPLVGLLLTCGGELRVGQIRANRPAVFARLRIETPPAEPQPPSTWPRDPFRAIEAKDHYQAELTTAGNRRASWSTESAALVAAFRDDFVIRRPGAELAAASDIWGALARADLYLAEPAAGFEQPVSRWLLAVTDGEHTAKRPKAPPTSLASKATLVVINGGGVQGDLEGLASVRFESLSAALRWLVEVVPGHRPEAQPLQETER